MNSRLGVSRLRDLQFHSRGPQSCPKSHVRVGRNLRRTLSDYADSCRWLRAVKGLKGACVTAHHCGLPFQQGRKYRPSLSSSQPRENPKNAESDPTPHGGKTFSIAV